MCRVGLFASSSMALSLIASVAGAQPRQNVPPGADRSNSQFTLRRESSGGADGQTARARARANDCAGALPYFDAAIKSSIDPSLRRDRGLCHDKLGDPYPAMDDFRAYLSARPDAPDADQIRQRLAALEGTSGSEATGPVNPDENPPGGVSGAASASVSIGGGGASASTSSSTALGPKPGEPRQPFDYYVEQEKLREGAQKSPLRYGTGLVLGPFVYLPRFFFGEGARHEFAYAAGGTLRYSLGRTLTLVSEVGYSGIGKAGEVTAQGGPIIMGGVELRFPVSTYAVDHLLLRGGVGYERNIVSGTRAIIDNLEGRFAFGYRHVFGTSIGLEALADGGPVAVFPENSSTRLNGFIGLSVAFVVGF
jgi:hypothetical protein